MESIIKNVSMELISKFINDNIELADLKTKIPRAVNSKDKFEASESQLYSVIVDSINKLVYNQYEGNQDKIYEATARLLEAFKDKKK